MFVVSKHQYAKKARLYESEYYYNPELDGVTHKDFLKDLKLKTITNVK